MSRALLCLSALLSACEQQTPADYSASRQRWLRSEIRVVEMPDAGATCFVMFGGYGGNSPALSCVREVRP